MSKRFLWTAIGDWERRFAEWVKLDGSEEIGLGFCVGTSNYIIICCEACTIAEVHAMDASRHIIVILLI